MNRPTCRFLALLLIGALLSAAGSGPSYCHTHGDCDSRAEASSKSVGWQSASTHWHLNFWGVELTVEHPSDLPIDGSLTVDPAWHLGAIGELLNGPLASDPMTRRTASLNSVGLPTDLQPPRGEHHWQSVDTAAPQRSPSAGRTQVLRI